ncbi:hypothetical protein SUGI_0442580 [Cryptomeria japonica]|nr:hypothetical protein SUGI_0442580 [Cryptomeria japonica]
MMLLKIIMDDAQFEIPISDVMMDGFVKSRRIPQEIGFRSRSIVPLVQIQRSRRSAPAVARNNNQKLKNLYSLLPRNCKKDKHSILANTTYYLTELKLRVCELEQQVKVSTNQFQGIFLIVKREE